MFFTERRLIHFSTIKSWLSSKQPRLLVTINDSCSVKKGGNMAFPAPWHVSPEAATNVARSLFLVDKGWYHINTSSAGEYALSQSGENYGAQVVGVEGTPFSWSFYELLIGNQEDSLGWEAATLKLKDRVNSQFELLYPNGYRHQNGFIQRSQLVWGQRDGRIPTR
jgi:hypothetical protein